MACDRRILVAEAVRLFVEPSFDPVAVFGDPAYHLPSADVAPVFGRVVTCQLCFVGRGPRFLPGLILACIGDMAVRADGQCAELFIIAFCQSSHAKRNCRARRMLGTMTTVDPAHIIRRDTS